MHTLLCEWQKAPPEPSGLIPEILVAVLRDRRSWNLFPKAQRLFLKARGCVCLCPSLELRIIRAVTIINNDKETGNCISSVVTNVIIIILLLLYMSLSPQVWGTFIILVSLNS